MWLKFAVTALLCVVVLTPLAASAADPPDGFRGLKWGASVTRSLKKMVGPTDDGTSMYVPASGKSTGPLFGIPVAEEGYSFSHGRFYSGSAWLDGHDNLVKMKEVLMGKFGPPSFANEASGIWSWKWPGSKITVALTYQTKFARTTVLFQNDAI